MKLTPQEIRQLREQAQAADRAIHRQSAPSFRLTPMFLAGCILSIARPIVESEVRKAMGLKPHGTDFGR